MRKELGVQSDLDRFAGSFEGRTKMLEESLREFREEIQKKIAEHPAVVNDDSLASQDSANCSLSRRREQGCANSGPRYQESRPVPFVGSAFFMAPNVFRQASPSRKVESGQSSDTQPLRIPIPITDQNG